MTKTHEHSTQTPCPICGGKMMETEKHGFIAHQYYCEKCGTIPEKRVINRLKEKMESK